MNKLLMENGFRNRLVGIQRYHLMPMQSAQEPIPVTSTHSHGSAKNLRRSTLCACLFTLLKHFRQTCGSFNVPHEPIGDAEVPALQACQPSAVD